MELGLIKQTVQKTADAIASVLDLDVIIVDAEMNVIGNTYSRMVEDDINVHLDSIVGETVTTGDRQVYLDKEERERCRICEYSDRCIIGGVLSVPIVNHGTMSGAIGVIFPALDVSDWVRKNRDGVISFLENMAELLSSKLDSILQIEHIEKSQYERELIIETISDALVLIDNDGRIVYRNSRFDEYFKVRDDVGGRPILSVVAHPIIENHLANRRNVTDKTIILDNPELSFQGLISCRNIQVNGKILGTIAIFRKIEEAFRLVREISNKIDHLDFKDMICASEATRQIFSEAKEVAVRDDNIMITGSVGTGKQLMAGAIHRFSNRRNRYLMTVHCGALSRKQYLATFFGIGGTEVQVGEFQMVSGGTVLLLEICRLPLSIQNDLCEYLRTGEISLETGAVVKPNDIRFIATSSEDLLARVKSGDLLEDLYFRLREKTIALPDLKERTIVEFRAFVDAFLEKFRRIYGKTIEFTVAAFESLWNYSWPGNVKELGRVLEKLVIRFGDGRVDVNDIESLLSAGFVGGSDDVLTIDEYERRIFSNALNCYSGSRNAVALAAERLGISRATLYRKIRKYNLDQNPDIRSIS